MDNLPMDALLLQVWQMVSSYLAAPWTTLQNIFTASSAPLLIGIIRGLLFARALRALLIVTVLAAVGIIAVRVFDITLPKLG